MRPPRLMLRILACGLLLFGGSLGWAGDPAIDSTLLTVAQFGGGRMQASAVVVDVEERWAITAYHVVARGTDHRALFPIWENGKLVTRPQPYWSQLTNDQGLKVRVLRVEVGADLALIALPSVPPHAKAVSLAPRLPQAGDELRLVGNPAAKNRCWDQEKGVVRDRKEMAWNWGKDRGFRSCVVQFESDAPLTDGYSGGPILDREGHLCGLILASEKPGSRLHYGADLTVLRRFLARSYALEAMSDLVSPAAPRLVHKATTIDPNDGWVRAASLLTQAIRPRVSQKPLLP